MATYSIVAKENLNIVPGFFAPVHVRWPQYNGNLTNLMEFTMYDGDELWDIPSTIRQVVISGTKADGTGFSYYCTRSGSVVRAPLMKQMTITRGPVPCNIGFFDASNNQINSALFILDVEPAGLTSETLASSNDFQTFIDYANSAKYYSELSKSYAVGHSGIRAGENVDNSEYYAYLARMYKGSPLIAATAAEMTDKTRVYVYVGNETGYTNGNWYYWNDSAWVAGGVYNAQGVQTDKELITPDIAADAEAVGKRILGFVTPQMFGAYGDGSHDDTQAIQDAIDSGKNVKLFGTYLISEQININTESVIDGCDSLIKVSDDFSGESAIYIHDITTTRMSFVKNIRVDCNAKLINGIYVHNKRITLKDCIVQYCGGVAYYLNEAGGTHILNCSASNVGSRTYIGSEFANSIALKNDSADTYIDTFDFIDFKIGVEHTKAFGFYNNIHGFVLSYLDYTWEGSCFFKTTGLYSYALTIMNSYPDSQQYAYDLMGHGYVNIIGGATYINTSVWNDDDRSKDNTYIIKHSNDVIINIIGVTIRGSNTGESDSDYILFSQESYTSFVNLTNCNFYHVVDNTKMIEVPVPTFTGREYTVKKLTKINESTYFLDLIFTINPSIQGAITNDDNIATMSSLTYIGRVPSIISNLFSDKESYIRMQRLDGMYYTGTSQHTKFYPLIAYRRDSGLYIRPLESDDLITDANNNTTYTFVVSGVISLE